MGLLRGSIDRSMLAETEESQRMVKIGGDDQSGQGKKEEPVNLCERESYIIIIGSLVRCRFIINSCYLPGEGSLSSIYQKQY